jgi:hypothetical protein
VPPWLRPAGASAPGRRSLPERQPGASSKPPGRGSPLWPTAIVASHARPTHHHTLACAALAGSRYFVEYYQAAYRRLGFDDAAVVELAGLVNHYTSFNTISHGFQLESPGQAEFAARRADQAGGA